MTKMFIYIVLTMSVKQAASMARLLAILSESKSIELLDRDEITRRVIIRASPSDAGFLELVVEKYAASASFEVKAYTKKNVNAKTLGRIGASYIKHRRLLFYWLCDEGAVFGEKKPRSRLLLKYCRRSMEVDPASIPYSLCSFNPFEHRISEVLDKARACFENLLRMLGDEMEKLPKN